MAFIKVKINKIALYDMLIAHMQVIKEMGDAVLDWSGTFGSAGEMLDGTILTGSCDEIIAELEELKAKAKTGEPE